MRILLAIEKYRPDSKSVILTKRILQDTVSAAVIVLYVSRGSTSVYYQTAVGIQESLTEKEWSYRTSLESKIVHAFHPWNTNVRFEHRVGEPSQVICDVAEEYKVDLVILGQSHSDKTHPRASRVVHSVVDKTHRSVLVAI